MDMADGSILVTMTTLLFYQVSSGLCPHTIPHCPHSALWHAKVLSYDVLYPVKCLILLLSSSQAYNGVYGETWDRLTVSCLNRFYFT